MEKNKRMQFYGGTLGACAPLLVFMCLMIVIAAMKKVSLVLFCMAGFAGLCVAFLLAKKTDLRFRGAPWYVYLVGVLGIAIVASSSWCTLRVGASVMLAI